MILNVTLICEVLLYSNQARINLTLIKIKINLHDNFLLINGSYILIKVFKFDLNTD